MKNIKQKKNRYYDKDADVFYFGVKEGVEEEFVEVAPGVNVELDKKGKVIGLEILNASKILSPIMGSGIVMPRVMPRIDYQLNRRAKVLTT